jgi:hypothetical protein
MKKSDQLHAQIMLWLRTATWYLLERRLGGSKGEFGKEKNVGPF